MPSATQLPDRESANLTWVHLVDGQPRVRWQRIVAFLTAFVAINYPAAVIVSRFIELPINPVVILAPLCMVSGFLVLAVEIQRHRLQYGEWKVRFSLRGVLLLTAIAAVLLALASGAARENQRLMAENEPLKKELETVMQGGTACISMPGGRSITCQVTRASFSDDDLASMILLASRGGDRACELSTLFLGKTSITDAGVCQLGACEKLTFVELPPMNLSDEAIDALARCKRLEFLVIDRRCVTVRHLDRLRKSLPRVKLNGRTLGNPGD